MSLRERIDACTNSFSDRRKTLSDPKAKSESTYKVVNTKEKQFDIVQMDDCVFDSNETKCDYGLYVDNTIHFIELKGSDNNQGLRQLYQTLTNTQEQYKHCTKKVRLIVSKAEAPQYLDRTTIAKIAMLTGDILNGKKQHFIKTNNTFTEEII